MSSSDLTEAPPSPVAKSDVISRSTSDEASIIPPTANMYPLPDIVTSKFSKNFRVEENVEVTSVDIAAHGGFVVVGCGNGMVLMYPMNAQNQTGLLVGFIQAKGLHTNLLLTVKVTEDCRFCFAGVLKGTSEMVAIDLGRLPVAETFVQGTGSGSKKRNTLTAEGIVVYKHNDAKLRGFGAAIRVVDPENTFGPRYRLVCGRGIKNVHVWQFVPPADPLGAPQWICMYDVPSNGNTIESFGFRNGGHEVLSKSKDVNLRVWDISIFDKDPSEKPAFEDIPNSSDVKCLLDDFAIGGVYDFAFVKLKAPKEANRDAFELPERSIEDDNGQRRKRMMRQIEDVIGTQDARHVLALCTDGGIIYYRNNSTEDFSMREFVSLQREPETERVWAIRRIGRAGQVALLRAIKISPPANAPATAKPYTSIQIQLLTDAASGEVQDTVIPAGCEWNNWGYYYDSSALPAHLRPSDYSASASTSELSLSHLHLLPADAGDDDKENNESPRSRSSSEQQVAPKSARAPVGRPPLGPSAGKIRRKKSYSQLSTTGDQQKVTPLRMLGMKSSSPANQKIPSSDADDDKDDFTTPAITVAGVATAPPRISPLDAINRMASTNDVDQSPPHKTFTGVKRPRAATSIDRPLRRPGFTATATATEAVQPIPFMHYPDDDRAPKKRHSLVLETAPQARRFVESVETIPAPAKSIATTDLLARFNILKESWLNNTKKHAAAVVDPSKLPATLYVAAGTQTYKLGSTASHRLVAISGEHDRLCTQFVTEVVRSVTDFVRRSGDQFVSVSGGDEAEAVGRDEIAAPAASSVDGESVAKLVVSYQRTSSTMLRRQEAELRGARSMDMIMSGQSLSADLFASAEHTLPQLRFRHQDVFFSALQFDLLAKKLVEKARSFYSYTAGTAAVEGISVPEAATTAATAAAAVPVPVSDADLDQSTVRAAAEAFVSLSAPVEIVANQ